VGARLRAKTAALEAAISFVYDIVYALTTSTSVERYVRSFRCMMARWVVRRTH
jgi:hypothetical protein